MRSGYKFNPLCPVRSGESRRVCVCVCVCVFVYVCKSHNACCVLANPRGIKIESCARFKPGCIFFSPPVCKHALEDFTRFKMSYGRFSALRPQIKPAARSSLTCQAVLGVLDPQTSHIIDVDRNHVYC